MSNFPSNLDDDTTLPVVNDNITEIGGEAINALREAVFNIEENIGLGAQGSTLSIAARLGVSLLPDGYLKPSVITNLGFVTYGGGGITNSEVNVNANIAETKLSLDHNTQDLYNYITDLANDVNNANGWISTTGFKLNPHISGSGYNHTLDHIEVASDPNLYLKNKFRTFRNNSNAFQVLNDINNEFLNHQWADGSPIDSIQDIITNNGSTYPSNYAHTASGIFLNTTRFSTIPETAQDLQTFAQFIDSSSIFLYGTRIQNLYSNGISRVSRSSNLAIDGYGPAVVPPTSAIAYLKNAGLSNNPFDDIDTGDDIIEFKPDASDRITLSFDEKFALVKPGDVVRINYGTIETSFIIKEKKYQSDPNPIFNRYLVRIAGKNLKYSPLASARIDRSLINSNKFGVLALASAQILNDETNVLSSPDLPSLIVGTPRGGMALGLGFNPDQFDTSHYNLYLALFTTGFTQDGYSILPAIDVTGNAGTTPGKYTLESIVEATNLAFRKPGFNYRFIAFSYKGEFGIMLADSYNNAAFSIVSAAVSSNGTYDQAATNVNLPNNVVGVFSNTLKTPADPLGFGSNGSGIASPPFMDVYGSSAAALLPTKLFTALKRNNYYVDGVEKDKLNLEVDQLLDTYGDGYWNATVDGYTSIPGASPTGRVQTVYHIPLNLSSSNLKIGKTIVVQADGYSLNNSGRFIIEDISFECSPNDNTYITVYDSVHAVGFSPNAILPNGSPVKIYFNSDSLSFNQESATDFGSYTPFKRSFEIYIDSQANTFTHERARVYIGGPSISINGIPLVSSSVANNFDIVKISPKLRGYQFGTINKITLRIFNYSQTTGLYDGYLATTSDYINFNLTGQHVYGKIGEVVRFYDQSNIDYIDLILNINSGQSSFTNVNIDFQIFPSLSLDDQIMMIGTCQVNDTTRSISQIRDERQFGNTSEKDFSSSALDYISAPERFLNGNGVINGFDIASTNNAVFGQIDLAGGTVLVNGKFIQINPQTVSVPPLLESNAGFYNINWAVCINSNGEYQLIPLLDKFSVLSASFGPPGITNRIFTVYNTTNGNIYTMDSSTFGNLISNRKDLTILYIITSFVTPDEVFTLTVSDARKYIYNESLNIPFTWVSSDGDRPEVVGHFNSVASLTTWANMFGTNNSIIKVKGTFNVDDTSVIDLTKIRNKIIFEGDGATFNITSPIGIKVKQNITFRNINFNYNPGGFSVDGNINATGGCIFGDTNIYSTEKFIKNITVENCIFTSTGSLHPPYICFRVAPDQVEFINGFIDNLVIVNNKFNDSVSNLPAIAILNTYQDQTNSGQPASVIADTLIENNICNKNQIFFLASTFTVTASGAGDTPGLVALNVVIRNNRVGYIAYSTSGNISYSTAVAAKENGLFIQDNKCIAVISPVDQTGKVPANYITPVRTSYNRFCGTGTVVIANNRLNFISTVNRRVASNSLAGSLIIRDNKLEAYDYANTVKAIFNFDASADTFILGTGTTYAIAIYVSYTTATTGESNINTIIENNVITNGRDPSNAYFYEGFIWSYVPALVQGNTLSGIFGNAKIGLTLRSFGIASLISGSYSTSPTLVYNKATNNIIYRSTAEIRSYIEGFKEVTDNFFDSSYCDNSATNATVVSGATTGDYRNKNEIYTLSVRAAEVGSVVAANNIASGYYENFAQPGTNANPYSSGITGDTTINSVKYGIADGFSGLGGYSQLVVGITNPGDKIAWIVPLDQLVPYKARLSEVYVDYKISSPATGNKNITLSLVSKGISPTDFSYAYGTATYTGNTESTPATLEINTISFPFANLTEITLGHNYLVVLMEAVFVGTFFIDNLIIKYIY